MKRLVLAMMVMVSGACGGDDDGSTADPSQACDQLVEVLCAKYFECTTEAERDALGIPETEAACISELKDTYGCAEVTLDNVCDGSETYVSSAAAECLDQLDAAECGQLRDGYDEEEDAPACGETCQVE
jgi:hypothetical protein